MVEDINFFQVLVKEIYNIFLKFKINVELESLD